MSRSQLTIAAAFGLLVAAAVALLTFGMPGGGAQPAASASAPPAAEVPGSARPTANQSSAPPPTHPRRYHQAKPSPTLWIPPVNGPSYAIIGLDKGAEVPVYSRPGGKVMTTLADQTEFGSERTFSVVKSGSSWFGVIAPELPNGTLGWVRFDSAEMNRYWTKYRLDADLSARTLTLSYGKQRIASYPVTVGGPGSETPTGRFAITDGLTFDSSPYYGCCAMVTNGHQTSLPPGWLGGDRIAIHGTPGPVGGAVSHGCLRATDTTMRALMARVALGTPLFVHA